MVAQFLRALKLWHRRLLRQPGAKSNYTKIMKHNKSKPLISGSTGKGRAAVTLRLQAYGANRAGVYRPVNERPKPAKKVGIICPTSKQPYVLNVRWLNNEPETREIVRWKAEIADSHRKMRRIVARTGRKPYVILTDTFIPGAQVRPEQAFSKHGGI